MGDCLLDFILNSYLLHAHHKALFFTHLKMLNVFELTLSLLLFPTHYSIPIPTRFNDILESKKLIGNKKYIRKQPVSSIVSFLEHLHSFLMVKGQSVARQRDWDTEGVLKIGRWKLNFLPLEFYNKNCFKNSSNE